MGPLGPFPAGSRLGIAVSGGADSLCLAQLATAWAAPRGLSLTAFIVDHGLRPESASEAAETAERLATLGLPCAILPLTSLRAGPGLSARARAARYGALEAACHRAGIVDLLLGHHRADQAETLLLRMLGGSGADGLAGMAPLTETAGLRLLRPLLTVPPARLRQTLIAAGRSWVEDPSNHHASFTRARLRLLRADQAGHGPATRALGAAAAAFAQRSAEAEAEAALFLAREAQISPLGYALMPADGPWPARALGPLIAALGGRAHMPPGRAVGLIAADPGRAIGQGITHAGVQLRPAGRLGPGFLLCREAAGIAPPLPARPTILWDSRFRLAAGAGLLPSGAMLGALGPDAKHFRSRSSLPAILLETLPCLRQADGQVWAVPALGLGPAGLRLCFAPAQAVSRARYIMPG